MRSATASVRMSTYSVARAAPRHLHGCVRMRTYIGGVRMLPHRGTVLQGQASKIPRPPSYERPSSLVKPSQKTLVHW